MSDEQVQDTQETAATEAPATEAPKQTKEEKAAAKKAANEEKKAAANAEAKKLAEEKKAEAKAEKEQKKAEAEAAKKAKEQARAKDTQNGITRPSSGVTRLVWDRADALSKEAGGPVERSVLTAALVGEVQTGTIHTQYGRWRKYYGLSETRDERSARLQAIRDKNAAARAEAKAKKDAEKAAKEAAKQAEQPAPAQQSELPIDAAQNEADDAGAAAASE